MDIRRLNTWQEWLEADRIVGTAFLHKWNEKEATEKFQAQAEGKQPRDEEAWGLFDEAGKMVTAIVTSCDRRAFEGQVLDCGEAHMVASLPEARGRGNVRSLMAAVLEDFRARGCAFATLIPFSFSFYRKFGFELAMRVLRQKVPTGELAGFACDYAVKRVDDEADMPVLRGLYEAFIRDKNLAIVKKDKDWVYRGNGEYGEKDWWHGDAPNYAYIFSDGTGKARAYLKFVFVEGPNGPFTGTMEISELVYDSPEAFRNVLGFIYGMRAKIVDVSFELLNDVDLSILVPNGDKVERKLDGHCLARVLDPERVLQALRAPAGEGSYTVRLDDAFMPENSGTYAVRYADGRAISVCRAEGTADLEVTEETFCQLAVGLINLAEAEYRTGTRVNGNRAVLEKVFVHKKLGLH